MVDRTKKDPQDQAFGAAAAHDQESADQLADASNGQAVEAAGEQPLRDPAPRAGAKAPED